jgi:hypothetical protein
LRPLESIGTIISTFTSLELRPELLRAVTELGFTEPTPVQIAAIPAALAGRDVLASAAAENPPLSAYRSFRRSPICRKARRAL